MVPSTRKISTSDGTMPQAHFQMSGQPRSVRASGGSAGTSCGRKMLTSADERAEQQHLEDRGADGAGIHVADRAPSWSASTISTSDGGMSWVIVPEAAITPVAMPHVVAVAHHHRQRDQPHGDHRGRDRAGDGAEHGADQDHRVGEPAAHRAEQLADPFEQVLGEAAALEDRAHEGEERDGEQQVVGDDAEDALGQRLQQAGMKVAELDRDAAEGQARAPRARRRRDSRSA